VDLLELQGQLEQTARQGVLEPQVFSDPLATQEQQGQPVSRGDLDQQEQQDPMGQQDLQEIQEQQELLDPVDQQERLVLLVLLEVRVPQALQVQEEEPDPQEVLELQGQPVS
jgi:hypothetical protein